MKEQGPILVVAACIRKGGTILLTQRNQSASPHADQKWGLPGGKVHLEESLHEAVKREILEELGAKISITRLLPHVQSNIYYDRTDPELPTLHAIVLAFVALLQPDSSDPYPQEPGIKEVRWVSSKDLDSLELLPGTKEFIHAVTNSGEATYKEGMS